MKIKNILSLILALCLVLGLCACGGGEETTETEAATEAATEAVTEAATEAATEASEETEADNGTVTYKVTVVDEAGAPIAGAMVQICLDTCLPGMTNAEGVAEYQVAEADYKVSFLALPEGYTYTTEETEFYFESGSTEMTITLKAEG